MHDSSSVNCYNRILLNLFSLFNGYKTGELRDDGELHAQLDYVILSILLQNLRKHKRVALNQRPHPIHCMSVSKYEHYYSSLSF